jgi:formamidopyrimidine-DNA glycosylase
MPELPEVETIVRRLRPCLIGRKIRSVRVLTPSVLRIPQGEFRRRLRGTIIREIQRKGKFILFDLDPAATLVLHLKMTGQVFFEPFGTEPDGHSHLILAFEEGTGQLRYRDVRKFGFFDLLGHKGQENPPYLAGIGPDPFEIDPSSFVRLLSSKKRRIKPLLLDQRVISGLGNIYVDEALFQARIHPLTPASEVPTESLQNLYRVLKRVLSRALRAQGSTLRDYRKPDGKAGRFQHLHQVYGRAGQPCPSCGVGIRKTRVSGRGTHYCPNCQSF